MIRPAIGPVSFQDSEDSEPKQPAFRRGSSPGASCRSGGGPWQRADQSRGHRGMRSVRMRSALSGRACNGQPGHCRRCLIAKPACPSTEAAIFLQTRCDNLVSRTSPARIASASLRESRSIDSFRQTQPQSLRLKLYKHEKRDTAVKAVSSTPLQLCCRESEGFLTRHGCKKLDGLDWTEKPCHPRATRIA